jgi:hypothetical protein
LGRVPANGVEIPLQACRCAHEEYLAWRGDPQCGVSRAGGTPRCPPSRSWYRASARCARARNLQPTSPRPRQGGQRSVPAARYSSASAAVRATIATTGAVHGTPALPTTPESGRGQLVLGTTCLALPPSPRMTITALPSPCTPRRRAPVIADQRAELHVHNDGADEPHSTPSDRRRNLW